MKEISDIACNKKGSKNMNITDVRVRKMTKEGKMKAVVSITIDNEFVVHDIKVVEGDKGLFIAMPSRKAADGEYRDIAHPINSDTRSNIQKIVLDVIIFVTRNVKTNIMVTSIIPIYQVAAGEKKLNIACTYSLIG